MVLIPGKLDLYKQHQHHVGNTRNSASEPNLSPTASLQIEPQNCTDTHMHIPNASQIHMSQDISINMSPTYSVSEEEKTFPTIIPNHNDVPMSTVYDSDDDYIVPDDESCDTETTEYDLDHINPKPISNIFMHHPHFNTNNPVFQCAMNSFIEEKTHCLQQLGASTTIEIPISTINVQIQDPENPVKISNVTAAADNGSDIEAIGINAILYYKARNLIRRDKFGVTIATGNGPIHVYNYVPITVRSKVGNKYDCKFWCLESLPTYDYLVGKHLMYKLGWRLLNIYDTWVHKPANIDHVDDELDELLCTRYPWKGEPEPDINVDAIKIPDPELRPFIKSQLRQYNHVIAKHEWDSGRITSIPEFKIDLIDEDHEYKKGFISKEYWSNAGQRKEMRQQIAGMKQYELIETCTNPQYVSPIFPVQKKTGDVRIVFDYRKLNEITKKYLYPIPNTTKLLQKFKGKQYITSLDLKGGYWHIPIKESDRYKTAFIFENNIYQWRVLPFGPTNAPMFFQQCMQKIFGHLDFVAIYLDDISILSDSIEEHKEHLRIVFELLQQHCIKLRLDKCLWGVAESEYLGFIVDKIGTKCKESYIQKIMNVPLPQTKTQLKRFLGLVQFLHQFIPQLHESISVLSPMTSTKLPDRLVWNDHQKNIFHKLKEIVQSVEPLAHPDISRPFHVFTDASKNGIGGMLAQEHDGKMQPIAYCSKVFTDTQARWHVSEQEIYASIFCVEKWSELLRYQKFILHTDHKNLQTLFNKAVNFKSGKLFRWAVRLQDYHFECRYIKGKDNIVADYLSRESVDVQIQNSDGELYDKVKRFYDARDQLQYIPSNHNMIRQQLSNTGGIDIVKLYTLHYQISIINRSTNTHYFHHSNPFRILIDDTHRQPIQTPHKDILSPYSHQFLNIALSDQCTLIKRSMDYQLPSNHTNIFPIKHCKINNNLVYQHPNYH